jgi:hypothetical protein
MCDQLSKEYYITLEVPVQVTCSVRADTIVEAMAVAIGQVGTDGLESYHMDYDVMDMADVKRVEEL